MGGAGAVILGLLYARHFCYVQGLIGQTVARNHRPSRIEQLSTLWGAPHAALQDADGGLVWDRMDATRLLAAHPEAREQFVFTRHGKDDPVIHFGAVVQRSPLTGRSFYEALEHERVGHYVVWDEGGHGSSDPVMGRLWADWNWHRVTHPQTFLRRDRPFPAFTRSGGNEDPGWGRGNGKVTWDPESGYAAEVSVPGDCGWAGDPAGALNRFLRWDAVLTFETEDQLQRPLRIHNGAGISAREPGYPTIGNRYEGPIPVAVDVTPRRLRRLHLEPGDGVRWSFGTVEGVATATWDGTVTIPELPLDTSWNTLVVERL
mgnify:CR=1 FL=1